MINDKMRNEKKVKIGIYIQIYEANILFNLSMSIF